MGQAASVAQLEGMAKAILVQADVLEGAVARGSWLSVDVEFAKLMGLVNGMKQMLVRGGR